jgi:hypothetical protein
MTSDKLNETLRELTRLTVEESREGFTLLMVASASTTRSTVPSSHATRRWRSRKMRTARPLN